MLGQWVCSVAADLLFALFLRKPLHSSKLAHAAAAASSEGLRTFTCLQFLLTWDILKPFRARCYAPFPLCGRAAK